MPRPDDTDELAQHRLAGLGLPLPPPPPPPAPTAGSHDRGRLDLADRLRTWDVVASGRALLWLAGACVFLLLVTGWALMRPRAAAPSASPPVAMPVAPLPSPTPSGMVVDVGGRVRHPGLVTLPVGSRVADAVRAAGGALRARDLAVLNLAARVSDGQLLLVGMSVSVGAVAGDPAASAGPVNLNTATADQLDALPGIGPVLAQRIIDWRTAHGGFKSVRDLDQVSGIGDSIFAELEPLVAV